MLVEMPRMLREIISAHLRAQPAFLVTDVRQTSERLLEAAVRSDAQVVVFGSDSSELPGIGRELLERRPHMKLLAVAADGRRTWLYELRPHREALGEVSPDRLAEAIQEAVLQPAGAW